MNQASVVDQRLPLMSIFLWTEEQGRVERALRVRVNLVVQGKSLTKPPFWQVKYLQTRVLYVA